MSVQNFNYNCLANRLYVKHSKNTSVESPTSASLIPTRSNTPENERNSNSDNFSDRDSVGDNGPDFKRYVSASSINSMDYGIDSPTFEIDVKPKKKNFNSSEERRLFVEDYKRKYKTEMCKNWELKGKCKFGNKCCFAHGRHELKAKVLTHVKYKTKPCKQYHQTGYCPYGQRCQYLHKEAIQPNVFCNPAEGRFKHNPQLYDILHEVNRLCNTDCELDAVLDIFPERPRLSVFQKFIDMEA
jgi:hypothetical protein